jgi:hypothetical protein
MPEQNGPVETGFAHLADELERRAAERHPCELQPSWRVLGQGGGESWSAKVHDISRTGICLEVPCGIRPGTVLIIRLHGRGEKLSRPLAVRIMHCTARPEGDWLIGCVFVRPLLEEQLRELRSDS